MLALALVALQVITMPDVVGGATFKCVTTSAGSENDGYEGTYFHGYDYQVQATGADAPNIGGGNRVDDTWTGPDDAPADTFAGTTTSYDVSSRCDPRFVVLMVWKLAFGSSLSIGCGSPCRPVCSDSRFRWFPRAMHQWPFANLALPLVLCVLYIAAQ